MCTVTFIPGNDNQYILTSSRDEQTSRLIAAGPAIEEYDKYKLLYPQDPKGGGTWISCNNTGKTVCLFNGAFKAHKPKYPYRHSRGIIILDFFKFEETRRFIKEYNFSNIEPFSLIIINGDSLDEFKWDGQKTHLINHDFKKPKIWSSVTLYAPQIIKLREKWFQEWKNKYSTPLQADIIDFHLTAGNGKKENDVLMERKALSLRTVSITSVLVLQNKGIMKYLDLLNNATLSQELYIN